MTPVPPSRSLRRGWAFLASLCLLLILFGTLSPGEPHVDGAFPWDKLQHLSAFALLAFTTRMAGLSSFITLPSLVVLGIMIECLQLVIPYRSAEGMDALADTLGIIIGLCACLGLRLARRMWYLSQ